MAPVFIGTLNSMFNAIEAPRISAREVDTDARTAKERIDFETFG
jgi:hypothetical protein